MIFQSKSIAKNITFKTKGDKLLVPWEVLQSSSLIDVSCVYVSDGVRITTNKVQVELSPSGYNSEVDGSLPPSKDTFEQIMHEISVYKKDVLDEAKLLDEESAAKLYSDLNILETHVKEIESSLYPGKITGELTFKEFDFSYCSETCEVISDPYLLASHEYHADSPENILIHITLETDGISDVLDIPLSNLITDDVYVGECEAQNIGLLILAIYGAPFSFISLGDNGPVVSEEQKQDIIQIAIIPADSGTLYLTDIDATVCTGDRITCDLSEFTPLQDTDGAILSFTTNRPVRMNKESYLSIVSDDGTKLESIPLSNMAMQKSRTEWAAFIEFGFIFSGMSYSLNDVGIFPGDKQNTFTILVGSDFINNAPEGSSICIVTPGIPEVSPLSGGDTYKKAETYSKSEIDVMLSNVFPSVTVDDNGKFLRVIDGVWAVEAIPIAEEGSY